MWLRSSTTRPDDGRRPGVRRKSTPPDRVCGKVGDFEKKSVCVKPGTARFAALETIKYYPLSPYADRLPFGPAIPSGCTCGAVLRLWGVPYASSTEGMTQRQPRPCLGPLSA